MSKVQNICYVSSNDMIEACWTIFIRIFIGVIAIDMLTLGYA